MYLLVFTYTCILTKCTVKEAKCKTHFKTDGDVAFHTCMITKMLVLDCSNITEEKNNM
jgi:hypothetical protein